MGLGATVVACRSPVQSTTSSRCRHQAARTGAFGLSLRKPEHKRCRARPHRMSPSDVAKLKSEKIIGDS